MNSYESDSDSGEMEMPPVQSIEEFWGELVLFEPTVQISCSAAKACTWSRSLIRFLDSLHAGVELSSKKKKLQWETEDDDDDIDIEKTLELRQVSNINKKYDKY